MNRLGFGFNLRESKLTCIQGVNRIKLVRNKKLAELAAEKRTVAGHINNGSMDLGMMRVEQVIRLQRIMKALEILELFLEMVKARLEYLAKQKDIPAEMWTSIMSIAFASTRLADVPELAKLQKVFDSKFGRAMFVGVTQEDPTPGSGVQAQLLVYLSVEPPRVQEKVEAALEVMDEVGTNTSGEELRAQLQKTALPFRRRPSSGNIPDPYFQGGGYIPPTTPPPPLTGNSPHEGPQTHPDRAHSNLGSQTPVPRIPVTYEYDESFNPASTVASEIPESMLSTDHGRGSRPSRWYSLEAPFKFQSQAFSEGDSLYADQQTALAARPYTTAMRLAVGGEVDGAVDVPLLDCTNYPGEEEYPGVCVEGFQGRAGCLPSAPPGPANVTSPREGDSIYPDPLEWTDHPPDL